MHIHPKANLIGLGILIAGVASFITSAQLDPVTARVERVIDGDTIQVRFEGNSYTVRLMGVDAPETKHPTKAVQYFGREASAFTKAHLEGKTVALARDRTGDTVDRYGRVLRYVLLDGDNFNARLIREGYAHAYRRFPGIAYDVLQLARSGGPLFAPLPLASLIEHCRVRPAGDMPFGDAPIRFRAVRRTGLSCAMFYRFPSQEPVCADARLAPERSAHLGASVTRPCLCRPCPSPAAGGAFLPRQGLGVFRHSRVSGKRSQTLNSLGGKT